MMQLCAELYEHAFFFFFFFFFLHSNFEAEGVIFCCKKTSLHKMTMFLVTSDPA